MKHLFSSDVWKSVARRLTESTSFLGFDFDGTLAPLAATPQQARLTTETRRLIQGVAQRFACAVISSRPQADVRNRLEGAAVWQVIGNDSLEPRDSRVRHELVVSNWIPWLARQFAPSSGILVENKGMSVALHYRGAVNRDGARRRIEEVLTCLEQTHVTHGREVVNVHPEGAPGKRHALARILERWPASSVLYVGDDESDEEVFRLDHPDLISIRIGPTINSAARYFLNAQSEINELMRRALASAS